MRVFVRAFLIASVLLAATACGSDDSSSEEKKDLVAADGVADAADQTADDLAVADLESKDLADTTTADLADNVPTPDGSDPKDLLDIQEDTAKPDTTTDTAADLDVGKDTQPPEDVVDVAPCEPSCEGRECGSDGCQGSCGECSEGQSCILGQCEGFCTPNCGNRECGGDGCGGSCGTCTQGASCLPTGVCEVPALPTNWSCDASLWNDGSVCNCACGALDVDCWATLGHTSQGCAEGESCTPNGSCAVNLPAWTLAVFLNGDNDLESYALEDLDEMLAVGSTQQVNILVLADTRTGPAYTYRVGTGSLQLLQENGELDLSSWEVLRDFGIWAFSAYPAQHYGLVIWDHGSGWRLLYKGGKFKGISSDDSGATSEISVAKGELASALHAIAQAVGRKIDLLGFDACLMGSWEVATSVAPYADWMVGSEELEPGTGWEYQPFLQDLTTYPDTTPQELAERIVETYYVGSEENSTLCAVDLSKVSALSTSITSLATLFLLDADSYDSLDVIRAVTLGLSNDLDAGERSFKDLGDLASRLASLSSLPQAIRDQAQAVGDALVQAVVLSRGQAPDFAHATGLSIYFPARDYCMNHNYSLAAGSTWGQEGLWDDFLTNWSQFDCGNWICDGDWYGAGDGCDCNCGAWDPDCDDPEAKVYHCELGQTCSQPGVCSGDVQQICEQWTCAPAYYGGHDGCDCLCGCYDPDCDNPDSQVLNCQLGQTCDPQGQCAGTPIEVCDSWSCDPTYYGVGDGCDCDCGCWDPDCDDPNADVWGCDEGEQCLAPNGTCG